MHGRLKVKDSSEKAAEKAIEREKKRVKYVAGIQFLFEMRERGSYNAEAFKSSALLLQVNPDALTLWCIRREILLYLRKRHYENKLLRSEDDGNKTEKTTETADEQDGEVADEKDASSTNHVEHSDWKGLPQTWKELASSELSVVASCLQANPKSYGAWHHRFWVLQQLCNDISEEDQQKVWKEELELCNLFLSKDERNFHCWDHRRAVTACGAVPAERELRFSLDLIERNFSNYSAWHYRSKLLPLVHAPPPDSCYPIHENTFHKELERVVNAVFTDPGDQSPWFFLRWLLQKQASKPQLVHMTVSRKEDGSAEVVSSFSRVVDEAAVSAMSPLHLATHVTWTSASGRPLDSVWLCEVAGDAAGDVVVAGGERVPLSAVDVSLRVTGAAVACPAAARAVLHTLLHDCRLLHQLDADNKWVLMSLAEVLCFLGSTDNVTEACDLLQRLSSVDPLRAGYYTDRRSSLKLQEAVAVQITDSTTGQETKFNGRSLGLPRLLLPHLLACCTHVDLANNNITDLAGACKLVSCTHLVLDGNPLTCLQPLSRLRRLREVSLASCGLQSGAQLAPLSALSSLRSLVLLNNEFPPSEIPVIRNSFQDVVSLKV
ncbi:geranylgeranyl transferase type-2 subunit alpha [Hyalella azteca]|uniref:Geranylgeranyl transferase type-2 subunit alpha n=1 Tax=Hyalella azteca TaxID=294128 RepID=A0A8B7NVQ6_HYAAZ|nr:geranylgeranyl transferase type-2 subunit alpha [Hyalella azteca]